MLAQGLVLWAVHPGCSENSKMVLKVTAQFPIKISKQLIVISIASGPMCNTKHNPAVGKNQNACRKTN
jgi:hypothetical protein